MFLPQETFGKYFIMFRTVGPITTGFYVIVAGEDDTSVNITGGQQTTTRIAKAGDWISQEADYRWIECQRPCQVVYFQNSSCILKGRPNNEADPSLLLVTPVELFYFIYVCIVPTAQMNHYLSLMTPAGKGVLFKTQPGQTGIVTSEVKKPIKLPKSARWGSWELNTLVAQRGSCIVIYSRAIRFGCFLHGETKGSSYMHNAGFVSSNIQNCVISTATANDLFDNDCDGLVDEEFLDQNG
ncbi:hypothetical protein Btru_014739 [Bulinus truncatus]|nr:hypothetical protein Btru_014739 [Bulinus truncatus]